MTDRNAFAPRNSALGASPEEFWALWEEHQPHLQKLCTRWLAGDAQEAHDIMGAVMMRAFEARETAPRAAFRAWITRIARNMITDLQRSDGRHAHVAAQDELRSRSASPSIAQTPDQEMERREQMQHLLRALEGLPLRIRTPMVMRCVQEKAYRDIAREIHISDAHARKLVQQGREHLRKMLNLPHQADPLAPIKSETWLLTLLSEEEALSEFPPKPRFGMPVLMQQGNGTQRTEVVFVEERPGRLDQKLKSLSRYVSRFSSGWKKRVELAEVLLLMGKRQDAIQHLERVLRRQPQRTHVRIMLGQQLIAAGKGAQAVQCLRNGLEQVKKEATRLHLHALIHLAEGDPHQAANAFKQALLLEPAERAHLVALARVELQMGQAWQAWELLREALRLDPADAEALHFGRLALAESGALVLLDGLEQHILGLEDTVAVAQEVAVQRLLRMHAEPDLALLRKKMRQLAQAVDGALPWVEAKVLDAALKGKPQAGLALLRTQVSRQPAHLDAKLLAMRWASPLGDAEWSLRLAAQLMHHHADDRTVVLQVLRHCTTHAQWQQWAQDAQEEWPQDATLLTALATGHMERGENELAYAAILQAVQLQPSRLEPWRMAMHLANRLSLHAEAQEHVRQAWSAPAMSWSPLVASECALLMGELAERQDGKEAAVEWRELAARMAFSAIHLHPRKSMHYRGLALQALGDEEGGAKAMRSAGDGSWPDCQILS